MFLKNKDIILKLEDQKLQTMQLYVITNYLHHVKNVNWQPIVIDQRQ